MPNKAQYEQAHGNSRREFLERKTTEELRSALDPMTPTDQKKTYVGDGGRTIIRQILAEREANGLQPKD